MNDGAHQGVSAGRAIRTILGGEPEPTEVERMSPAQMLDWLRSCPPFDRNNPEVDDDTYSECARYAAKLVLDWLLADPRRAQSPVETVYDWNGDPEHGVGGMNPAHVIERGWYDRMKADGIDLASLGLSGFMWGWACNAARYAVELPPAPNPALITVSYKDVNDD
jgi:hypothetical protein